MNTTPKSFCVFEQTFRFCITKVDTPDHPTYPLYEVDIHTKIDNTDYVKSGTVLASKLIDLKDPKTCPFALINPYEIFLDSFTVPLPPAPRKIDLNKPLPIPFNLDFDSEDSESDTEEIDDMFIPKNDKLPKPIPLNSVVPNAPERKVLTRSNAFIQNPIFKDPAQEKLVLPVPPMKRKDSRFPVSTPPPAKKFKYNKA